MFARLTKRKKDQSHLFKNITRDIDPQSEWKKLGELGEGAFGMVYKVISTYVRVLN